MRRILTREEVHGFIDRHRISQFGIVVVLDVVREMEFVGDIALGQTFIRYFQDNSLRQRGYAVYVYYCLCSLVCRVDSHQLSSEEIDMFLEIAEEFWSQDMDNFFVDRMALAHGRHVAKLLDVVERICFQVSTGRLPRSADSYWNAYVALFDAVNAPFVSEGKVKLDKMRCRQLYNRVQSIKPLQNERIIRSSNLRDGLGSLKANIQTLPV